jgi:hypothetical protein
MNGPVPPENVRAVMVDGREIPLECRYAGVDEQGMHSWEAVWSLPEWPAEVLIGALPPRTVVGLAVER